MTESTSSNDGEASLETELLFEVVRDAHLLSSIVLIGASALIPIPFLDDVAKAHLERRLFRAVAKKEKMSITGDEVSRLTQAPPKGCFVWGCLTGAVIYPIKRLIRKILYFLEIKRAVDQSTTALAEAWLFRLALRRGLWSTGRPPEQVDRLREVIEAACHSQGVKPLEAAVHHAFEGAKGTLKGFARKFTRKTGRDEQQMERAVDELETEEKERLDTLTERLIEALNSVSGSYLQGFAEQFEQRLAQAETAPVDLA